MEIKKIVKVEEELSRFQRALRDLRKEQELQGKALKERVKKGEVAPDSFVVQHASEFITAPKLTGSLKRSSMDLTRALAELRKP